MYTMLRQIDRSDMTSSTLEAQLSRDETVNEKQDHEIDNPYSVDVDTIFEDDESGQIQASLSVSQASIPEQISVAAAESTPIDDQISNVDSVSTTPSPVSNVDEQVSIKEYGATSKSETTPISPLAPDEAVDAVGNENGIADHNQPSGFSGKTEDGISIESRNLNDINSSIKDKDLGILDTTETPDKVDDFETPSAIDNEESTNEFGSFHATGVEADEDPIKPLYTSSDHEKADDFGSLDEGNAVQNKVDEFEPSETTVGQDHDHDDHFGDGEADEFGGFDDDDDPFGGDDEFGEFDDNDEFGDADDFGAFDDNDGNDDDHFGDFDRANIKEAPVTSPSDNAVYSSQLIATPFQEIPANIKNAIVSTNYAGCSF
jgi:hypothetical protein